jgi:N-acetylmuramoyl-L-alanine amidase
MCRYVGLMLRALILCIAWLAFLPAAVAQPSVTGVRLGIHPHKVRFVMEMTEEPQYRVFTLPDPFRLVIDLPELSWRPKSDDVGRKSGLVTAMRFGLFAPGTSRVVLDMSAPFRVKTVFLIPPQESYPYRFVIDIEPISRAAFFKLDRTKQFTSREPLAPLRSHVPPPKVAADNRPTIVIDPGHGGVDPGARSITGADEKDIVLAYGRDLRRRLEATGKYHVIMTRDTDVFISLSDRRKIAQENDADLFVSLHANNHSLAKIRGASVYTLSEKASDAEAKLVAARENTADVIAGIDLTGQPDDVGDILFDLVQRETMNLSKKFANILVGDLGKVTPLLRNTHRYAGFAVLKSPVVPSVLVEIGYLSNRAEERMLLSAKHRTALIGATTRAINNYFEQQEALNRS